MATTLERTPENLLLATLHKVGTECRLVDDFTLAKIFNDAARKFGGAFKQFAWHPHYHVSETLSETLQLLDHAGSIVRENAAQTYFRVSPHTAGPFGQKALDALESEDRRRVEMISDQIREVFEKQNVAGDTD